MENQGWIKLHRQLLDNPLWKDCTPNQKVVLITILLMADHKGNKWIFKGEEYETKPGEFVTSLKSISEACGVSTQVVRGALLKFEKHDFSTSKSTNKNRLIKVEKWGKYQCEYTKENKQLNKHSTSTQQADNN